MNPDEANHTARAHARARTRQLQRALYRAAKASPTRRRCRMIIELLVLTIGIVGRGMRGLGLVLLLSAPGWIVPPTRSAHARVCRVVERGRPKKETRPPGPRNAQRQVTAGGLRNASPLLSLPRAPHGNWSARFHTLAQPLS